MKKVTYFISVLLTCICLNRNAFAIWPDFTPLLPWSPQFCATCLPAAVSSAVSSYDQVMYYKKTLADATNLTKIKQFFISYAIKYGHMWLDDKLRNLSKKKNVASYSRTILDSEREGVDIKKEDSVKADFVNLFLQYPNDYTKMEKAYRTKGDDIKMDTALEMYITSAEMMKELCGNDGKGCEQAAAMMAGSDDNITFEFDNMGMMLQLSAMEMCLMEGKYCEELGIAACGIGETPKSEDTGETEENEEDAVCHWKSALQVARIYDQMMRYNEYLVQMQHQYEAVMGIGSVAKIRYKQDSEKSASGVKESFLNNKHLPKAIDMVYKSEFTYPVAFADMGLSAQDLKAFSDYERMIDDHENVMGGNFEVIEKVEGFESVLDDKDDDIASLRIIERVRQSLDEAKVYHNMKQMLPEYKKIFKNYHQTKEYHDKTVEFLADAGECVKGFLAPYYKNPENTWFGKECDYMDAGLVYCHYNPEKPISDHNISTGLYDVFCPDNKDYKCYVQKLEDIDFDSGISGMLLAYYNQGKIDDALADTSAYLGGDDVSVNVSSKKSNEYTTNVEIQDGVLTSESADMYVTSREDDEHLDDIGADVSKVSPSVASLKQSQNTSKDYSDNNRNVKNPEDGDTLVAETRKSSIMNWLWGSVVSKEISADLDSLSPKFGSRINKFPLWNDQKEFYDQYIDGKYVNIGKYVKEVPIPDILLNIALDVNANLPYKNVLNDLGEVIKTAEQIRMETAKGLETLRSIAENKDRDPKSVIDGYIAEEDELLEKIQKKYEADIARLVREKENISELLRSVNTQLSEANEEYNSLADEGATAGESANISASGEKYGKELADRYDTPMEFNDSPINRQFSEDRQLGEEGKANAKVKKETVLAKAEGLERSSDILAKRLEQKKKEIEQRRRDFVKEYSDAEISSRKAFGENISKYAASRIIDAEFVGKMAAKSFYPDAAIAAGKLVSCVREYAFERVEEAQSKLEELKKNENIYYIENVAMVHKIHDDLIKAISNVPASRCLPISGFGSISNMADIAVPALQMFGKICADGHCSAEDSEYFVGALALKEDLSAPKSPVDFSSAPMREIFHLDVVDYNNIEKYYEDDVDLSDNRNITITADGFLNSGLELPEIWKYILKRHAFGQKQFDLARLLGNEKLGDDVRGFPEKNYLRSGVFPCRIDGRIADVGASSSQNGTTIRLSGLGYTLNQSSDASLYPVVDCRGYSIVSGKVHDYVADGSVKASASLSSPKNVTESSELGSILSYIPDKGVELSAFLQSGAVKSAEDIAKEGRKLTFSPALLKAIQVISETQDLGKNKENDAVFYLSTRSLFDRNQFGDYLNQVEQEAIARDSLVKVENQIEDIRKSLRDIFYGTDIIISEDFDLLNESDYNDASETLDEQKQIYLDKAKSEIMEVKGISDTIKNKTLALMKAITVLETDKDEIVFIRGDEDVSELEAKIKNKSADTALSDEYETMGDEGHERRLKDLQPPYCAVYPL